MSSYYADRFKELDEKRKKKTSSNTSTEEKKKTTSTSVNSGGNSSAQSMFESLDNKRKKSMTSTLTQKDVDTWFTDASNTLKSMQDYHTQNEGKYNTSYGGDLAKKVNSLMSSAVDINRYLQVHKSEIGNYEEMTKLLSDYSSALEQNDLYNYRTSRYYSKFKDEADYNLQKTMYDIDNMSVFDLKDKVKTEGEDGIAYTTADGRNVTWGSLYNNKKTQEDFDYYYKIYSSRSDWDEKSKGIDNIEDTRSDYDIIFELSRTNVPYDRDSAMYYGIDEATYNDIEEKRQYISEKYGVDLSDIYNNVNVFNDLMAQLEDEEGEKESFEYLSYLTDDERAYLSYIYNTQGRAAALKWQNSIESTLQDRANQAQMKNMSMWADEHPVLSSLGSVALNTFAGIQYIGDAAEYLGTGELNTNQFALASSAIRGKVSEKVNWEIGNWDAFDFIYNTGMSMADSASAMATMGGLGGISLGLSAAAQATNDALNRGVSKDKAFWTGLLAGAFEGVFESASIGKFNALKETAVNSGADVVKNIAKTMLVNATEETFTEIANVATDIFVNGGFSQYETSVRQYINQGMTEAEAKKQAAIDVAKQIVEAGASGALMGFGFGAYGSGSAYINSSRANTAYGQSIMDSGNGQVDALANLAREMFSNESGLTALEGHRLADKVSDKATAKNVGNLAALVESTVSNKNANDLQKALVKQGLKKSKANIVAQYLTNGSVTAEQLAEIKSSESIQEAIDKVMVDDSFTLNKTSARMLDAMSGKAPSTSPKASVQKEKTPSVTENATTKEIATQSEFKVSESGKTKIGDTEVSIKEIASVKNGKMVLRLEDGSTVDAGDVEYGSSAEGLLYENVVEMGYTPTTANEFVKGYDGNMPVADYARDFSQAYRYGELGVPKNELYSEDFTSHLTESQKNYAYDLGKMDAKYKASEKAKLAKTSSKITDKIESKGKNKGKLHNSLKPTNEIQRSSLKALGTIAETLNIDIYTFESEVVNGKRKGANGWYDPSDNSLHLDLFAGNDGKGTMLFTAAHELTHHIREKLPAQFKLFADFLFEEYGAKGISVAELIENKREFLEAKGRITSDMTDAQAYDLAYEEVVADACESFLADGDAVAKIAELKAKDKTLWQTIKDFITKLVARIKAAYEGLSPDSVEGRYVAEMLDSAETLKAMWAEMLVEASEVSDIVEIDMDTESVAPVMFSERTWTASEYVTQRDQMADKIAKALGVSKAKASSYIDDINSIARTIANDRVRLDYEASSFGSAFVSNVEYGGSFDYTTLCKKRRIYTGTFTEIQKRLTDVALTPDDILTIRNLMLEEGIEATCGLCYVEGSRANMGKFAKEFIRLYKRDNPNAWIPNMADVNTPDGVEQMRISHPEAYEQYVYFWNHYGKLKDSDPALFASQQKPKLYEARKEYKGEILEHFKNDTTVEKKNRNGGIRMQSFSDFEIVHLIDTMQVIMDMSTVGLAGQAYTKVPEFAKAFGNTGLKINLSLIAKGVDADGNLIFDDREGMPHETAFDLRNKYSKNVGTIIVTFTDEQLLAAMADPRIDFIIPFHRSQWKKGQYGAMGLPKGTKDYTFMQNEKLIKKTYHEYRGRMVLDKASNYMPNEYWDFSKSGKENAEAYLKMCAENNKRPKFYKLLDYDGNGTYSLKADGSTDGYWKLLIDFKMYDNDGVGSPQNAVTPTFNMDEAKTMLDEYQGGHNKYPVASAVVDKFVDSYNKEHRTKYSDRTDIVDTNGKEYDHVIELDYKVFDKVKRSGKAYIDFIRNNLISKKITVYNSNGESEVIEFAKENERVAKDGSTNFRRVLGELEQARNEVKKLVILNVDETTKISQFASHKDENTHQWLDKNGWDYRTSYVMTNDGMIYPVTLFVAKARDGRNILYDVNIEIKEGISIDKIATSLRSNKNARQAVKVPKPSNQGLYHENTDLSSGKNKNTPHSDRPSDSVSNRSLLANALESVAQNDIERNKLAQYKQKISLIESEQAKLAEIRAKIKELSFAKGKRDTKAINDLQFEANQTANRINTYDRQLLNLESTKALKDVIDREKQMAYKKAQKEGKEALARQREKATKTQRELLTRYQESRKKGIEGRRQTEMRHKIKDVVNELNQYLTKGTKDKHVPIQLQKSVAEALNAVNMDTVGAEERIAKKQAEMRVAKSLEEMQKLSKEIEHIQEMGGKMDAKLSRLKTAYDSIINSDDPLIANSHDDVISNTIDKVIEVVGDTPLRDMSLYQLEAVYDMYRMVLTSIRNANKTFKAEKGKEISVLANTVIADLDGKKRNPLNPANTEFAWNNLKPVYAFERIGSNTFTKVFNAVREGEDVWAKDMSEAQTFREEQFATYKYDTWDFDKKYPFKTNRDVPFELDLGEMMSIYAFAKDEHSKGHLIGEGFVFDSKKKVVEEVKGKIKVKVNLEDATSYNLSESTLAAIIDTLTPEQKAFADAMQEYLSSTMGEKGNEVSLELYEIKLFKNKNYFPLKVAPQYMAIAKEKAQGDVKIKNKGFTKDRKEGAKNPIVLSSFMDVWATHVNEMSMYHAFTLPLEDFYRVFNYKTPYMEGYAPMSVNQSIQNAHGVAATSYIEQLLKDINGGAISDPRETTGKALMSKFKKASVMASMSVVIQQPSAIARAMALVDAKYFAGKKATNGKHKDVWAEVKKYAPVAVIKEMGYFDTGMGKGSVEWLKGEKTFMDKVDDVTSKLPALADEVTWVAIWNAVKRETLHTHKNLIPNSEEFLKAVGERFTEVIVKTQVYDSTLARSANMRSKSGLMNMWTAFMAEPTTSINMLQDAFHKGNKKYIGRALGAVFGSVVLNSALVSLVYAMRDDDDDETFLEKYLSRLTTEVIDGVIPITYIPFFKDIWSLAQGFDVERADMSLINDVIDSLQQLFKEISKDTSDMDEDEFAEHKKAITEAILGITDTIASLAGVPVKNVRRDINGIINGFNTIKKDVNGRETTAGSLGDNILEDVKDSIPIWGWFPNESKGDKLYDAIMKGDTAYIDRLKGAYKSDSAYQSAIRKALRENDSRIKEAAKARYNGDIAEYMRIAKEIIAEGHFKQDDIVAAINSEINALKKGEETTESSTSSNKVTSIYKVDDYYAALVGRDQATAYVVKEDLIKTDVANGKDRDEAEADFNSKFASYLREKYEDGDISDYDAQDMLINYAGKSEEDAYSKVQYWAFKQEYPDYDLSEEAVKKYYNEVEPSGIDIDVYYDYSKQRAKCKGTDSNGDGKTDSGSVKSEVLYVIDSLPISSSQKDVLYYLNGWSSSTLWEAPWH